MTYNPVAVIEVLCWGKKVGALAPHPQYPLYVFEYYPSFVRSGIELAPLTLPLSKPTPAVFPYLSEETYKRLPACIADSLPDSFGNNLITAWMQNQGVRKEDITVLDRLAYVGKRAMGALEFKPAIDQKDKKSSALEMKGIVETARRLLSFDQGFLAADEAGIAQLIQVGTSAGGAKAKVVVGYNPRTQSIVSGHFDVPEGYEHWIIKINTSEDATKDYGCIEYAYYLMARACGITMAESSMLDVAGRMHFMTKRFDRTDNNEKVHMQTLCAMSELDYNQRATHDYVQLFETMRSLGLERRAFDEVFDRMVFNVCTANNDDHTKNHSFILAQGGVWSLAPAYDLMHACVPGNLWLSQHLMGVNGVFSSISRSDLVAMGNRFGILKPHERIDRILELAMNWPQFAHEAELSKEETARVYQDIESCCQLVKKC